MTTQPSSASLKQTVNYYICMLRRNEIIFLIVVFSVTILGGISSFYMASEFEAKTVVLMEREGVLNPMTNDSVISSRLENKLQSINEVISSRSFLLRVVDKLNLDAGLTKNEEVERLIGEMQKNINVRSRALSRDRRDETSHIFWITYRNVDPVRAHAVDSTISDLFIEDNLNVVRQQHNASLNFLETMLVEYKTKLEEAEKRLREFKEVNIGEMPGQENTTLRALDRYLIQLEVVDLELRQTQLDKSALEKQISKEKPMIVSSSTNSGSTLEGLKLRLNQMRIHYTDQHPDVIQLAKTIKRLEKNAASETMREPIDSNKSEEVSIINPTYQKLREELLNAERNIRRLEDKKRVYETKINQYEVKVLAVPSKEQELTRLTRDYNVSNEIYQLLLKRLAEAQFTKELDISQRGDRFTILEPATVPIFPVKPNRPKILVFSLILSCMLGGGVIFLRDSLDDSLKSVDEAKAFLQVPVLAIIPDLKSATKLRRKRFWRLTIVGIGSTVLIALGIYVAFNDQRILMKLPILYKVKMKVLALLNL